MCSNLNRGIVHFSNETLFLACYFCHANTVCQAMASKILGTVLAVSPSRVARPPQRIIARILIFFTISPSCYRQDFSDEVSCVFLPSTVSLRTHKHRLTVYATKGQLRFIITKFTINAYGLMLNANVSVNGSV